MATSTPGGKAPPTTTQCTSPPLTVAPGVAKLESATTTATATSDPLSPYSEATYTLNGKEMEVINDCGGLRLTAINGLPRKLPVDKLV